VSDRGALGMSWTFKSQGWCGGNWPAMGFAKIGAKLVYSSGRQLMSSGGSVSFDRVSDGVSVTCVSAVLTLISSEGSSRVGAVPFFCHSIIWQRVGKRE
jgi:hypothetical protein